jgi:hypothetical protein
VKAWLFLGLRHDAAQKCTAMEKSHVPGHDVSEIEVLDRLACFLSDSDPSVQDSVDSESVR